MGRRPHRACRGDEIGRICRSGPDEPMTTGSVAPERLTRGVLRRANEDHHLLNDGIRLWAVADGMGGHSHGEVASRMVVDALNSVAPTVGLNAALDSVSVALTRVNTDLRRGALGIRRDERASSTVVGLAVRGSEWGVFWAGDSRAYRYRSGSLTQLTRDHTVALDEARSKAARWRLSWRGETKSLGRSVAMMCWNWTTPAGSLSSRIGSSCAAMVCTTPSAKPR